MSKSGIGIGSASVLLVFAVLCLTIFALISYVTANNEKALADAEARLVSAYYAADVMAERICAEALRGMDEMPDNILGTQIYWGFDADTWDITAEYACYVTDEKELYVKLVFDGGSGSGGYTIQSWKMRDTRDWEIIFDIPVWTGDMSDIFIHIGND